MNNLTDILSQIDNIMGVELMNSEPIVGERRKRFKELIKLDLDFESLYHNNHLLIITDPSEYEELIKTDIIKDIEEVILLKIPQFNMFIWAGNYLKNQQLKELPLKLDK